MSRTQLLIASGALITLVSGLALAQDGTERRIRRIEPIHEITPELRAELVAIEAAARPPPMRAPDPSMGPPFELEVQLDALVDGHVRVSVAVTPQDAARMIGVREVSSAEELADGVLYKGRLHTSYPLDDPDLELPLIPLTGEQVVLKLARRVDQTAFVVGWRRP